MQLARLQFLQLAAGAVAIVFVTLSGQAVWSQTGSTIKIIVPFPAGGVADTLARMRADQIGRTHGPLIVIENGGRCGLGHRDRSRRARRAGWKHGSDHFEWPPYESALAEGGLRCAHELRAD